MVATVPGLRDEIDEILPGVIADRRHLHEHPELGFQEFDTAALVADRLRSLGLDDIQAGIATTGVTGLIRGGKGDGKVVLLRADMDALPIEEENEVEYRSRKSGVMHACGHDAHTAMLLGVTRILNERKSELDGTVKVLFQPAEEGGGGAKVMIDEGVLENPHVDAVFGLHVDQDSPVGTIGVCPGPAGAASDRFEITIQGRGAHAARPHRSVDPIVVGSEIVVALQTIVGREVDSVLPAVVTVGAFRAGNAANVIPDTALLRGTVRSFSPAVRQQLADRIEELVTGIAAAMRAEITLDYHFGYPPMVNDAEMTAMVREVACGVVGPDKVIDQPPAMGAEDFAYFLEAVPGAFFMVGTNNPDKGLVWSHHHPRFDLDEEGMAYGMETMVRTVLRYLGS